MSAALRRVASRCVSIVGDLPGYSRCRPTPTSNLITALRNAEFFLIAATQGNQTMLDMAQNANQALISGSRSFSSKSKEGGGASPLMNEALIKKIMDASSAASPDDIQLRLVVEKDPRTAPTSDVVTLRKAIRTSVDLELDLVEIALNQHPPVVRAVKYESKVYQANKKKREARSNKDPGSVLKEFLFRAQTADHDLQRKVEAVNATLKKGHRCKIVVRCRRQFAVANPRGSEQVLDLVLSKIGSAAEKLSTLETNEDKTQSTVTLILNRGS